MDILQDGQLFLAVLEVLPVGRELPALVSLAAAVVGTLVDDVVVVVDEGAVAAAAAVKVSGQTTVALGGRQMHTCRPAGQHALAEFPVPDSASAVSGVQTSQTECVPGRPSEQAPRGCCYGLFTVLLFSGW